MDSLSQIKPQVKDGIKVYKVKNETEGISLAKELLRQAVDNKTALFLSGGRTPKDFYTNLAQEASLAVGAVGLVDERYGPKMHENSNELMIKNTGLLKYLDTSNIRFYPILQDGENLENTAIQYDETLRYLFNYFPKSVGIIGVGLDGHTAGLPTGISNSKFLISNDLVVSMRNFPGELKERISLNFNALERVDLLIVLVFGKDKKEALKLMFSHGDIAEVPSRFLLKEEVAKKTILITDQIV